MEGYVNRKLKAFSLIEVLFYVSMLSVFILVISTFWGSLMEVQQRGRAMNAVSTEANFVMNRITQLIRNADSITVPVTGNTTSSITLDASLPGEDPTVIELNGGNIRMAQGANPFAVLNSPDVTITNLTFTNISRTNSSGAIRIVLSLSYSNPDGIQTLNYSQTIYATATLK